MRQKRVLDLGRWSGLRSSAWQHSGRKHVARPGQQDCLTTATTCGSLSNVGAKDLAIRQRPTGPVMTLVQVL